MTEDAPALEDGSLVIRPTSVGNYDIAVDGDVVGTLRLHLLPERPATASVWCEIAPEYQRRGHAVRALGLLVEEALRGPEVCRVEAYVPAGDRRALRLASRAGLRREGVARGFAPDGEGGRHDHVLVGRLADDPPVGSGEMFRATLNAGLPRTRTIAQGLLRNQRGEVLLAELIYKRPWDLPGGVVDPGESPAHAVVREIDEELQVQAQVSGLRVVTWLPPWKGWDDALLYLFEVTGVEESLDEAVTRSVLEPREIKAVHWADLDVVREQCAPYTVRLIEHALAADPAGGTVYLENGELPDWA